MSHEERNAWAALVAGIIGIAIFGRRIWTATADGAYSAPDGLAHWARDVLWMIGGGIAIGILVVIAFNIVYAIATHKGGASWVTDERDMMISRRGSLVTLVIISGGFIVAVALLAYGNSALTALNTTLAGMALGAIASELYRIAVYRFGM